LRPPRERDQRKSRACFTQNNVKANRMAALDMPQVTLTDRLVVPEAVVSRELDGEMVLLNLDSGVYFGLGEVGTAMWRAVHGTGALGDALDSILAQYDVERDVLRDDLLRLVDEMCGKGLLQRASG